MQTDTELLETKEFLYASTHSQLSGTPDQLRGAVRDLLHIHRFDVFSWLLSNGVSIPERLLFDGTHPRPGKQSPDQPVGQDEPEKPSKADVDPFSPPGV